MFLSDTKTKYTVWATNTVVNKEVLLWKLCTYLFFIYFKHLYNFSCYFLSKLKQEKDFKTRIRNGEKSETLIAEPGPFLVGSGSDSRCKSDIKNLLNIVIPVYYAPQTSTK